MEELTKDQAEIIADNIEKWCSSKKNQKRLRKSLGILRKRNKKLSESLRVSDEFMNQRITI